MEVFVVAEDFCGFAGPLGGVDDGAEGVDDATGEEEPYDGGAGGVPEVWEVGDDEPAEGAVDDDVDPAGVVDPYEVEEDGDGCADPGADEHPGFVGEGDEADGGVGDGDEDGYGGVVGALQPGDGGEGFPGATVVGGGDAEGEDNADGVDEDAGGLGAWEFEVAVGAEDGAGDDGEPGYYVVEPAAGDRSGAAVVVVAGVRDEVGGIFYGHISW